MTRASFLGESGFLVFDPMFVIPSCQASVNVPSPNPPCCCLQQLQVSVCFCMLSYAWSFFPLLSFCWPLAKEHVRRNRQSRTFLVENVIGEIWSELEEGSVLGCPLPLLSIIVGTSAFIFIKFALWVAGCFKGSGAALPGACGFACQKATQTESS